MKQFCGDVPVGGGRVRECLRQNEARLSPACKEDQAAAEARFKGLVEEFARGCGRDADRLCSDVKRGRGRVVACLMRQEDDLSSSCRAQIDRVQTATERIGNIRAACRADADRHCAGVPTEAGALLDCLQVHRDELSETCRSLDPWAALVQAEILDAVDSLKMEELSQETRQILQGVETIAFSRSLVLLQVDTYEGVRGIANADRLLFSPQVAFGDRKQFAIQLRAPVLAIYPYAPDHPAQTGLGAILTSFAWAFYGTTRVRQYLSLGLQWLSPVQPPIGQGWAVVPSYAISAELAPPVWGSVQTTWIRSLPSSGYSEVDLLLLQPILVLNLPGRSFLSVSTILVSNFVTGSRWPLIKGIAGLYLDRRKSVSISAWYQTGLWSLADSASNPEELSFRYAVGMGLSYFFDW